MKRSKLFLALVLVVLVILGGAYYYRHHFSSNSSTVTTSTSYGTVSLNVTDDKGMKKSYTDSLTKSGENAFDVLNDVEKNNKGFSFTYKQYSFGAMILSVNGLTPDASKAFWSFQVGGKDSAVGVSSYKVKNNDDLGLIVENLTK